MLAVLTVIKNFYLLIYYEKFSNISVHLELHYLSMVLEFSGTLVMQMFIVSFNYLLSLI